MSIKYMGLGFEPTTSRTSSPITTRSGHFSVLHNYAILKFVYYIVFQVYWQLKYFDL